MTRPGWFRPVWRWGVLACAVFVSALWCAPRAALWLIRPVPVATCDLMVILGGGASERVVTGIELARDGACGDLMFTVPEGGAEALRAFFEREGEHGAAAEIRASGGTLEDAVLSLRAARERGARSLLIVTSPYHTRRAGWIFARVFGGSGVGVGVYPSESFYVDYPRWWLSRDGRDVVLGELLKLFILGTFSETLVAGAGAAASA